jgi:hypothetical protein
MAVFHSQLNFRSIPENLEIQHHCLCSVKNLFFIFILKFSDEMLIIIALHLLPNLLTSYDTSTLLDSEKGLRNPKPSLG